MHAFKHQFGCSQLGHDLESTQKILAGLVRHPNAAAVLILGLGCENNQLSALCSTRSARAAPERVQYFNAQDVEDEVEEGMNRVRALARFAERFERQPLPASELILGMKCGGSDGLSGITANPLVGRIANRIAGYGGSVLLTEVPEMFGAEQVLLERATHRAKWRPGPSSMVNGFRAYFRKYNEPIDENPAPGNKAGGITTLAEKSLGCVQKAGQAPIAKVLGYGERAPAALERRRADQRAGQRRGLVDRARGGGRAHGAVHDRTRYADGLSGADASRSARTRRSPRRSRAGSTSTPGRSPRARAISRRSPTGCSSWCSTSPAAER